MHPKIPIPLQAFGLNFTEMGEMCLCIQNPNPDLFGDGVSAASSKPCIINRMIPGGDLAGAAAPQSPKSSTPNPKPEIP